MACCFNCWCAKAPWSLGTAGHAKKPRSATSTFWFCVTPCSAWASINKTCAWRTTCRTSAVCMPWCPPCALEPLTGVLRPRNFALLLFGLRTQFHVPGASSIFSTYPGTDRSTRTAERHELTSTLLEQAQRLIELLNGQIYKAFDKADLKNANARKYPQVALHEAAVSALVHRDYESYDPTRVTAFSDRIEFLSPGSLLAGVAKDEFESGRAPAKWRNEALAWFFNRLNPAQAEGQGIRTILRTMNAEGCRPRDSPPATQM
ncbi:MAG: hypothetical protein FJW31_14360 [Acidobacteria bacterium]|nr:hypothetical protein [Acidobacteriota bacterium]